MRIDKQTAAYYQNLADRYKLATGQVEYEAIEVVRWAVLRGDLEMSPVERENYFREILAESLRLDSTHDGRGRKVRLRHCIEVLKPAQRTLWAHIDDATDGFLLESLRQRRAKIDADVRQLQSDLEFINERRAAHGKRPIAMSFDFSSQADCDETRGAG